MASSARPHEALPPGSSDPCYVRGFALRAREPTALEYGRRKGMGADGAVRKHNGNLNVRCRVYHVFGSLRLIYRKSGSSASRDHVADPGRILTYWAFREAN